MSETEGLRRVGFEGSAVVVVAADDRVVAWDHGAEWLYGWSPEEALGRSLAELLVPEKLGAEAAQIMADLWAGHRSEWRGRFRVRRRDGSEFEVLAHDTPVVIDGRVIAVIGQSTPADGIWPLDADLAALDPGSSVGAVVGIREAWWELFRRAARSVVSLRALDELLQDVLATVANSLNADAASLLIADAGEVLVARAAYGWDSELTRPVMIPSGAGVSGRVLASKQPVNVDDLDEVEVASPELRRSGFHSYVGVPLMDSGRVLGVLHATSFERGRFGPSDVETLTALTGPLSAAVSRVTQVARSAELSNPTALPQLPGLEVSSRYLAADGGSGGGDWYDAIVRADGTAALVVGDAAGHGLEALIKANPVRHALMAYLHEGHSPARALGCAQQFVLDASFGAGVDFLTAAACTWDPRSRTLVSASAGHPPFLPVHRGQSRLGPPAGQPISAALHHPAPTYSDHAAVLEPGDLIVLYTDGLIQARDLSIDEGIAQLTASVVAGWQLPLDDLCRKLIQHGDTEDDRSAVLMRVPW